LRRRETANAGVFGAAREQRCSRVEWTTDTGNVDARAFYHQLGLPVHRSKVFYRVEGTGTGMPPIRGPELILGDPVSGAGGANRGGILGLPGAPRGRVYG
jgi:hypothetical protein